MPMADLGDKINRLGLFVAFGVLGALLVPGISTEQLHTASWAQMFFGGIYTACIFSFALDLGFRQGQRTVAGGFVDK